MVYSTKGRNALLGGHPAFVGGWGIVDTEYLVGRYGTVNELPSSLSFLKNREHMIVVVMCSFFVLGELEYGKGVLG